jgi:hypothetical protein
MRKMMKTMMSGKQPSPEQLAQMAGGAPRPKYRRR